MQFPNAESLFCNSESEPDQQGDSAVDTHDAWT